MVGDRAVESTRHPSEEVGKFVQNQEHYKEEEGADTVEKQVNNRGALGVDG